MSATSRDQHVPHASGSGASVAPEASAATAALQALQALLLAYQATFLNRTTPHARQRDDGSYRWRFQPCDHTVLSAHLSGSITVAVSSLDAAGRCRWLCLDADGAEGLAQLLQLRVRARLAEQGLPGVLEASRHGGHLWLLLAEPVSATLAHDVLLRLLAALRADGLSLDQVDLYPDTSRAGALGHAVRLPLGVHRLTRRRYPFLDEQGQPLPLTKLSAALTYLAEAPRTSLAHLTALQTQLAPLPDSDAEPPPLMAAADACTQPDPELEQEKEGDVIMSTSAATTPSPTRSGVMRWVDAHVSPLDLLAELAPACVPQRVGQGYLGWCPFHDD